MACGAAQCPEAAWWFGVEVRWNCVAVYSVPMSKLAFPEAPNDRLPFIPTAHEPCHAACGAGAVSSSFLRMRVHVLTSAKRMGH